MWKLQTKLKLLSRRLSQWSRDSIGDIHVQVNSCEAKMLILEDLDLNNNSPQDREELNKGYAKYIKWMGLQDSLMKQKARTNWFKEGDCNTNYFHKILRERRRRLHLYRIKNHRGNWIQGEDRIAKAATRNFKKCFNLNQVTRSREYLLNCIPNMIDAKENQMLIQIPEGAEIKAAIFSMSIESSTGPDGYNVIIDLSVLSGFVSGRLITENVMLAQEIIHDISKPNKGVIRLISNVWYTVIINGTRHGFFHSSQGLKQGDPLSPPLFIIAAEVLSRSLNKLNDHESFILFSMNKRGPHINHLAYADDIVIFCSGNSKSVKLIMKQITNYEKASGQLVNKEKSFFLTSIKTSPYRINRLRNCTDFMDKPFPFNYLGCPIYAGRKRIAYFDSMVTKVVKRMNGWQGKMLSFGGKVVLIKSVLQSLPTYTLSALNPLKTP
ncbi:uncharacterized protein LOC132643819 [Lycium barbarum]|uniref:uncharacterized protein LOC132643819 n=1 Tax=Lycium barbarum TaxID=112863 RepID=UPI00293F207F|nr:uncharacterized protein LOC132643819 [Lycium barbarum]